MTSIGRARRTIDIVLKHEPIPSPVEQPDKEPAKPQPGPIPVPVEKTGPEKADSAPK